MYKIIDSVEQIQHTANTALSSLPQKLMVVSSTTIQWCDPIFPDFFSLTYFSFLSLVRSFACSLGRVYSVYSNSTERVHVCVSIHTYVSTLLRHCRVVIDPLCSNSYHQLSPQKKLTHALLFKPLSAMLDYDNCSTRTLCVCDFIMYLKCFACILICESTA